MAATHISNHLFRPFPGIPAISRRRTTTKPTGLPLSPPKPSKSGKLNQKFKWVVRLGMAEQSWPKSTVDVNRLVGFLYEDLPHTFDDQGIDRTAYDERVKFRDPITKCDTICGYLFYIALLRNLFRPDFQLHWVKQKFKWVVRLRMEDQSSPKSTVDVNRLVGFLYEDLPHTFDDQGIDRTAYDERVKFRDPITKYDTISGYLFYIALLRNLFRHRTTISADGQS
ncbi:hypothetical protein U1Q18_028498 [Sarracenia purpurea var. burkii]